MLHFPCLQHSSTALNPGEPTGKYSAFIVSKFLCRYSFTILDLCWVALSTNMMNLLNFFLVSSRYAIKEWLSNRSYCLNSCLPSRDSTPKMIVLLCDPVTVTIGLLSFAIHFLLLVMAESCVKMDSSCTSKFQPFLRLVSIPLVLF